MEGIGRTSFEFTYRPAVLRYLFGGDDHGQYLTVNAGIMVRIHSPVNEETAMMQLSACNRRT